MNEKYVALTFDDGPNNIVSPAVLDRVEKYNVVATFFVNGKNISDDVKTVMDRALSLGCEYQNHSQNHKNMTEIDKQEIEYEINKTNELVEQYTGKKPEFFRPPFIRVNDLMFDTIDLTFICGTCSQDWSTDEPKEETAKIILSNVKAGDVILLHDSDYNMKTAEALDIIVPALLEQGYKFVTVSKLFDVYKTNKKKGIVYSNAINF